MKTNISVYGIFKSRLHLSEGLHQIRASGFRGEDISVLMPETDGSKDIGITNSTKSPEGVAVGGAVGAVAGAALGWVVGTGAVAIPEVAPYLVAGPLMVLLAGMGVGAVLGGLMGGLVGMGSPEYEAKRYDGRLKSGGFLVSIHCDDKVWVQKAKEVLVVTGAEVISAGAEAKGDYMVTDKPVVMSRL